SGGVVVAPRAHVAGGGEEARAKLRGGEVGVGAPREGQGAAHEGGAHAGAREGCVRRVVAVPRREHALAGRRDGDLRALGGEGAWEVRAVDARDGDDVGEAGGEEDA